MFKTIKEVLRVKNATTTYPATEVVRPYGARSKPAHDSKQCICCAACANACPPNAIQMVIDVQNGTETWSVNYGRCIFCGRCEEVCPVHAIVLTPEFELAVMDREDLEETAKYELQACDECGRYFATKKEVDYVSRILSQLPGDADAEGALQIVRKCPECKQKADAIRARKREETKGVTMAFTALEAYTDVDGAQELTVMAAETEKAGDES